MVVVTARDAPPGAARARRGHRRGCALPPDRGVFDSLPVHAGASITL
jgi:hypothetical protein